MRVIHLMVKRNLVRTFRNKGAVIIVILMSLLPALMLLVMGDFWMVPIFTSIVNDTEIAWSILRANILAITLAISSFTAPVSILGLISSDFENKTIDNYLTAPIKRSYISLSYIISGILFGLVYSVFIIIIGQALLLLVGDGFLGITTIVSMLSISLLVLASLSTIFFYIMSGVKSVQTAGAMTGLMGGFAPILGGVYIQLSLFPAAISTIINFLPFSHALTLMKRQTILPLTENSDITTEMREGIIEFTSIELKMFGEVVTPTISIIVIIASMILFGSLSIYRLLNMKKK